MNKKQIVQDVTNDLESIVQDFNYELVDVEFVKEGPSYYLRIYIDKEGGITIEDCQQTSRAIESVLDAKDPIDVPYILEVSSPGIDRILKKDKDFERFTGQVVDVKLYESINKQKFFQGELIQKNQDEIVIKDEDEKVIRLPWAQVASVRLAILF